MCDRLQGYKAGKGTGKKGPNGPGVWHRGELELAAYLMNRCDIGSGGKTPLQRVAMNVGEQDTKPILGEFGEKILYEPGQQEEESGNRDSIGIMACLLAC